MVVFTLRAINRNEREVPIGDDAILAVEFHTYISNTSCVHLSNGEVSCGSDHSEFGRGPNFSGDLELRTSQRLMDTTLVSR